MEDIVYLQAKHRKSVNFCQHSLLHCVLQAADDLYMRVSKQFTNKLLKTWRAKFADFKYIDDCFGDCTSCGWCTEYPISHISQNPNCAYLNAIYTIKQTDDGDVCYKLQSEPESAWNINYI